MNRFLVAALGALGALGASDALGASGAQQAPVQFETRADLVLVDANVLDGKGVPIPNLTADDFQITVDGRPRPIASVQFVKQDAAAPAAEAAPRPTHYSTNEGAATGRDIILVVDENSLPPTGARAVLASIERFLKGISPADRVAFVRMPSSQNSVDFTTDRDRIRDALKRVQGRPMRAGMNRVSVGEAAAYNRGNDMAFEQAVTRICAGLTGPALESCIADVQSEARQLWMEVEQRARESLDGLRGLIETMREMPGPKTLMLLSQGFTVEDRRQDVQHIARLAAEARVSIYALQIDLAAFDISDAQPSSTRFEDERIFNEGIDMLAGAARGARFRIVGTGETVFARVAQELSGYYLLGFEPTSEDRDGKPHRIRVEVSRPGVTVRARAQFTIGAAATAEAKAAAPGDQLVALLRKPTVEPGLPIRVAAFTAPADRAGHVRVIIGADVGTPTVAASNMQVGYVAVDGNGKVAANQLASVTLQPMSSFDPAPLRFLGHLEVPEGDYTLRFAAVDPEGRQGSVHHHVAARLATAGVIGVSDLIVAAPVRGQAGVRPEVHLRLEAPALQAMMELSATDPKRLNDARVTFEVAESPASGAILSERGRLGNPTGSRRPVSALIDVSVLPPGQYVARAVVSVPGEKPVTTMRPFEVAPRRRATGETRSANAPSATRAASRVRMRPPIPPFRKEDVLAPQVVVPFVDHLLENYSPSPAAREALEAIKAGDLQNATKGERQVTEIGMSFAQGVSLLAAGKTAQADAYFRAALRESSDFVGAAFYLGATLAAAGKDRDAVGAWQTALIGEVGSEGIYPVLIDGLLRVGDVEQALEFLEEAEPTFTDRDQYTRRLVQAYALAGRYAEAAPLALEYLTRHMDDVDMLFLGMHLIYERHASGEKLDPAELSRFREFAAKYEELKGPQILIVQGWRKALGIR